MAAHTITVEIAGNDKTASVTGLTFTDGINAIGTAKFSVVDSVGSYVPDDGDEVIISIDDEPRWSGEIVQPRSTFRGWNSGVKTDITAQDRNQILQRALINTIIPSQTIKQTLTDLCAGVLAPWDVTLDAGQADGPTLGVITAPWWTVEKLLKHIHDLTGWVYRIDASKELSMWLPGTRASGVSLALADASVISATWELKRFDYRNQQWLIYGPDAVLTVTDDFVGGEDDGPDGATRQFVLRYHPSKPATVTINPGESQVILPVGDYGNPADAALEWWYDSEAPASLRQNPSFDELTSGDTLRAVYDSQFPNNVFRQDAAEVTARGPWVRAERNASIETLAEAIAYADALIRKNLPRQKHPKIDSSDIEALAGETVGVYLPAIKLNTETFPITCLVLASSVFCQRAGEDVEPVATYTLTAGDEIHASSTDLWRRIIGGGSSGGSSLGSGGGGGGGTFTFSGGKVPIDLGGSHTGLIKSGSAAPAPGRVKRWLDPAWFPGGTVTVRAEIRTTHADTSVKAQLVRSTGAALVNESSPTTSTDWGIVVFAATLPAADYYEFYLQASNGDHSVQGAAMYLD